MTGATRAVIGSTSTARCAPSSGSCRGRRRAGVTIVEDAAQGQGATPRTGRASGRRRRRGHQLLSGQEPRRLRRRRRRGHHGDPARRASSGRSATTAAPRSTSTKSSAELSTRHAPGRRAAGQVPSSRRVERGARAAAGATTNCSRHRRSSDGPPAGNDHVWHLYVVRVVDRDQVLAHAGGGIGAGIHYPTPFHLHGHSPPRHSVGDFPVAEAASDTMISLPMLPHLSVDDQGASLRGLVGAMS